ncbi:uncharacterized protein LOC133204044 [Saccostrea echinata]|uniref:uncharacterized protein LOC133204044 n=1 Tax=Saccostrea echinata TaxID=191078 RepID=UPI002A832E4B|nr:uncharacterized protein LOC133204044 [Saccostrea echinata]
MDGQYGVTLTQCIVGIAIAFIFGSAYVLEVRYSDLHSEIKMRDAELAFIKQKIKNFESKVEMFERMYKQCEDKCISEEKETRNLTKRISIIESRIGDVENNQEDKRAVVFNAAISKTLDLQRNTPVNVVYDTVLFQTGNAYNPRNGFFTAPSGGLYVFSWATLVAARKIFDAELLVNGKRKGLGNCNNEANPGYENCACTISVVLKFGDEVNIRTTTANYIHGNHWSSFKGWKVW